MFRGIQMTIPEEILTINCLLITNKFILLFSDLCTQQIHDGVGKQKLQGLHVETRTDFEGSHHMMVAIIRDSLLFRASANHHQRAAAANDLKHRPWRSPRGVSSGIIFIKHNHEIMKYSKDS